MTRTTRTSSPQHLPPSLRFSTINLILLVAGLITIALGFTLLSRGSNVAAPVLLVVGYVILVPLGIIL